jgi:predicted dienelactone hydrolase
MAAELGLSPILGPSMSSKRCDRVVVALLAFVACREPGNAEETGGASGSSGSGSGDVGSSSGADGATTQATQATEASDSSTGDASELPFPPAGPDAAPDPSVMGPYPVGVMTVELLDDARPNDAGEPRRLVTEIWYPASEEARGQPGYVYTEEDLLTEEARAMLDMPLDVELATDAVRDAAPRTLREGREPDEAFPIVLFSHGSSGVRMQSTFLTVYLASHGYVVAAPDHLGNTLSDAVLGAGTVEQFESLGLRPDDMGFVLAHLQGLPGEDPLGAIVDGERVGAAGHSFGALTTLRLLAQGRPIDVAVAQAPPGLDIVWFGGLPVQPEEVDVPVMLHAGEVDTTTPLSDAVSVYEALGSPKTLLTVGAAGHFSFSDMCLLDAEAIEAATQIGLSEALDDGCSDDNIDHALALPLERHFAIGLFNGHLRDSPGSLALLTAEAADPLAPGMFELEQAP